MYALIKPFVDLCLLNAGPQDLPASELLVAFTLILYFLVSTILALPIYGLSGSLFQAVLDVGFLTAYTRVVLQLTMHLERYAQTLSALAGGGVVFGVLSLPLVYSIYKSSLGAANADALTLLAYLLVLAWLLVVYGHIFRHALSSGLFIGMLVGLGYILLTSVIIDIIVPAPGMN